MTNSFEKLLCRCCRASMFEAIVTLPGLRDRAERHRSGCDVCVADTEARATVERGLAALASQSDESAGAPDELRLRALSAFHQAEVEGPATVLPPGWLPRSVLVAGSLAAVVLVGSLLWTRLPDFGTPPRTVRIELPPGYAVSTRPTVTIRRASGEIEIR